VASRAQTLSRHHEEDGGHRSGRCRPRAGAISFTGRDAGCAHWRGRAGSAGPIPKQSQARLARLGRTKDGKGRGKGEAGRVGLSFQLGFGPLPNRN
jgi:hypothetical protein